MGFLSEAISFDALPSHITFSNMFRYETSKEAQALLNALLRKQQVLVDKKAESMRQWAQDSARKAGHNTNQSLWCFSDVTLTFHNTPVGCFFFSIMNSPRTQASIVNSKFISHREGQLSFENVLRWCIL